MSKEYHFGVVATFDEDTSTWEFQATYINGDDSPFREMDEEIYDPNYGDYGEWQCAHMTGSEGSVERANFILLTEAIEHAQHRLSTPGWLL